MAAKGQSIVTTYLAWNTASNAYQTGDVANHTLRLLKDGTEAAPTNGASEVDATNAPGLYALALTSAEAAFNTVDLAGKSATGNVVLIGKTYLFDNVPVFAPGANQGLLTLGSGAGQISTTSGFAAVSVSQWLGLPPSPLQGGLVQAAVLSGLVNANVTQFAGNATGATNIDRSTRSIALGTVSNASTTTTITLSTMSPANLTPSQFVGRIVNFDQATTTANLRGQSSNITASVTSSGGSLQVTALTDAPVFGDTFSVT